MYKNMHYGPIIENGLFAERHIEKKIRAFKPIMSVGFDDPQHYKRSPVTLESSQCLSLPF